MFEQASQVTPSGYQAPNTRLHTGVERFMAGVMGWMSAGVAVTAVVVYALSQAMASNVELAYTLFSGPTAFIVLLAPIGFVWFLGSRLATLSSGAAKACFLTFSALMGVSMSYIPLLYPAGSIGAAAGVAAATFGVTALFGYTTKKDMSGMGRFVFMALIGLLIAGLASAFIPALRFGVAAVGVLLFSALTAYDTQRLRQMYLVRGAAENLAIMGALELYLDVINLFRYLLVLFSGGNRD